MVKPEEIGIQGVHSPKNYTGAASTDEWFDMGQYNEGVTFIIRTGAWAGGTAAVTVEQATSNAGAGAKAVAFASYYDDVTATGTMVKKTATSNTFDLGDADKTFAIFIPNDALDTDNGFRWVNLAIASPGANADFYAAVLIGGPRYQQEEMNNPR